MLITLVRRYFFEQLETGPESNDCVAKNEFANL